MAPVSRETCKPADAIVDAFWGQSQFDRGDRIEVAGEHRCRWCNKTYIGRYGARSLKSHLTRGCDFEPKPRAGSRAEKAV